MSPGQQAALGLYWPEDGGGVSPHNLNREGGDDTACSFTTDELLSLSPTRNIRCLPCAVPAHSVKNDAHRAL